jgi:hypothetical protein
LSTHTADIKPEVESEHPEKYAGSTEQSAEGITVGKNDWQIGHCEKLTAGLAGDAF